MEKYVCIHGHFYQPPRENPWLEDIELQDAAYPYHDWNERITEECYLQNSASRILDDKKKIIDIVNNYSKISFDFGPTLLSWLQIHAPGVYESILEADRVSCEKYGGHGAAIAQAYNHIILPLANRRDKETQVIWGIRDFEYRFGRKPEGMWLPETAVDIESLEVLAENGIIFTVLAPGQAEKIKKFDAKQWKKLNGAEIDTRRAYLCRLPSGKTINIFFYHGGVSHDIAYGGLLNKGEYFAEKLVNIFDGYNNDSAQLAHIATDGESYGHHHRHGDMALAYCLYNIETNNLAKLTVYGEYLEKFPPEYEVQICENTSWSCAHGVERWRSNCGCNAGRFPSGKQQWREPLRKAMDWLSDNLAVLYENKMREFVDDPWLIRNQYIDVVLNRTEENINNFFTEAIKKEIDEKQKTIVLKLLEMQRNAMLMYTSCGWFFDNIAGIETLQVMQYASRAIQMAKEIGGEDYQDKYKDFLKEAVTNVKIYENGKAVYEALVQPTSIDLNRVGAHLAVSSIFDKFHKESDVFCYRASIGNYERTDAGIQILATGRAAIKSKVVLEKDAVDFAVMYFGDHNLMCAVNGQMSDANFKLMRDNLKKAFRKGDTTEVMRQMNLSFGGNSYTLWHLFKDAQRRILNRLLQTTWDDIESSFRHVFEHNYTIIQVMRSMNIPLPKALGEPAEFIINMDICREIQQKETDIDKLANLVEEAERLSVKLDTETMHFEASHKIDRLMSELEDSPDDYNLLEKIENILRLLKSTVSELDLYQAQNIFFDISKGKYPDMKKRAEQSDTEAKKWVDQFEKLADYLAIKL
ncbi:MAG: DUF3536 domain-containing protein [Phycisphaerae bacterium]|nr:DUF3536 domain-containing protein [Phycisphaerae bacterium]